LNERRHQIIGMTWDNAGRKLNEDYKCARERLSGVKGDDILWLSCEYKKKKEKLAAKMKMSLEELGSVELIKIKTTVVLTAVSLMGQW
jgi:hypothetical protein